jgi:small-conductance mechanosensitive channel
MILEKFIEQFSYPILIGGLILLGGVLISKFFENLTLRFLKKMRLALVLKRIGFEEIMEKFWAKFDVEKFLAQIVKWFFIILTLMAFFDALRLERVSNFFEAILHYFPNIFISVLIFLVAVYLLDFSKKIFIGTLEQKKISFTPLVGNSFSLFIWTITILAILYQLKIIPELISAIFFGLVAIVSLALGIAFGLGGKDLAAKFLKDLQEKLKK